MKNAFYIICISLLSITSSVAQESDGGFDKEKLFFGGGLSLQFGTITFIDIQPMVGYRVSDKLAVGVGLIYQYVKDDRYQQAYGYSSEYYTLGGKIFGRYFIFDNFFAHAEYQLLNVEDYDFTFNSTRRTNIDIFFVGGGFRQPLGPRSSFFAAILWDVIEDGRSPYQNPYFQIGFSAGF